MKSKTPLTRKEIQAAYRKRKVKEQRAELADLVTIAYKAGQGNPNGQTPTPTKIIRYAREIRDLQTRAARSQRAARMLDLLYGRDDTPAATDNT
jgi:hypothetical protein